MCGKPGVWDGPGLFYFFDIPPMISVRFLAVFLSISASLISRRRMLGNWRTRGSIGGFHFLFLSACVLRCGSRSRRRNSAGPQPRAGFCLDFFFLFSERSGGSGLSRSCWRGKRLGKGLCGNSRESPSQQPVISLLAGDKKGLGSVEITRQLLLIISSSGSEGGLLVPLWGRGPTLDEQLIITYADSFQCGPHDHTCTAP